MIICTILTESVSWPYATYGPFADSEEAVSFGRDFVSKFRDQNISSYCVGEVRKPSLSDDEVLSD